MEAAVAQLRLPGSGPYMGPKAFLPPSEAWLSPSLGPACCVGGDL